MKCSAISSNLSCVDRDCKAMDRAGCRKVAIFRGGSGVAHLVSSCFYRRLKYSVGAQIISGEMVGREDIINFLAALLEAFKR